MKKKVGTILDEQLLTAAKVVAAQEGKRLAEIIEEALLQYLRRWRGKGIVAKTKGALQAPSKVVQDILEEESVFEI
jgi:rRNA pseudouridine-1189 N-methylase Emg1 (Nep1/Mra1 family)